MENTHERALAYTLATEVQQDALGEITGGANMLVVPASVQVSNELLGVDVVFD